MDETTVEVLLAKHREREAYLMANMKRWRQVAEIEHASQCTSRHDCSLAIERIYNKLREEENG